MADPDLDIADQGGGLAFRAEMVATEFLYRYWKHLVLAVTLVVATISGYGFWRSSQVGQQRALTARIADIEAELPADVATLASAHAGLAQVSYTPDALREAADELVAVAESGSGTAAVEAWLKAAELYRISDATEARRTALDRAASHATGVLRYAAVSALANLDVEQGRNDDAVDRLRSLQSEPDFLARQATLDLAALHEALEQPAEAAKAYDAYLSRWPQAPDADDVRARRDKVQGPTG